MIRRVAVTALLLLLVLSVAGAYAAAGPEPGSPEPSAGQADPSSEGEEGDAEADEGDDAPDGDGDSDADEPDDPEDVVGPPTERERRIPDRYIVVYEDSVRSVDRETDQREDEEGFESDLRFEEAIEGFSAELTPGEVEELQEDPEVDFVSPDRKVEAEPVPLASGEPLPPTGVRRIGAATAQTTRAASEAGVAVIDTGVDLEHQDLDTSGGTNCIDPDSSADDDNGHGTHVAGTVAARNDGAGVVGVAPGTKVHPVKVLDSEGGGSSSSVICGIDWVTANASERGIEVANMSLGGAGDPIEDCGQTTDAERKALCNSVDAGINYVVAAGNDAWDFDYAEAPDTPAAYPEVLTVTALSDSDGAPGGDGSPPACDDIEDDDRYASFSNYAKTAAARAHTIAAPGTCIRSTWPGGGYRTISGTSMAAPHMAGAVALCLDEGGTEGPCAGLEPTEVIDEMRSQAEERTTADRDFGFFGDPFQPVSTNRYFGYLAWTGERAGDTKAPTVASTSPADGAVGEALGRTVSVTFDEPMDRASVEAAFALTRSGGAAVPGSFSWDGDTVTFDPSSDLGQGGRYVASVGVGARDAAGNPLAARRQWAFTTVDFADSVAVTAGILRTTTSTTPPRLDADDGILYRVESNSSSTRTAGFQATFRGVPKGLLGLSVGYRGSSTRTCSQATHAWDWTAKQGRGNWSVLDSRTVGTTEIGLNASPAAPLDRFVGGSTGQELRVRVQCTSSSSRFTLGGDLLRLSYHRP